MRVIYFTKYSKQGASSRLRSIQFFPLLEEKGFSITHSPLFTDNYLKALYNKKKNKNLIIILCYIKRFFSLLKVKKYDLIVIEKELFPYLPATIEILLNKIGVKYIVDYDDAIFHNYDMSNNAYLKSIANKIDLVMQNSKHVFAGNSYLAKRAENAGAKNITILPTVIDTKRYKVLSNKETNKFTLGWIGSPSTYKYIEELIPTFRKIREKYPLFQVNIIGAKQIYESQDNFINYIPWKENTEVEEINKFDVGIMPLHNTPWELGKCSYKLIQYMGCAKPIIGSPVGMNNDVIIEGYNGFVVKNNDWYSAISYFIDHQNEINIMGKKGRSLIDNKYNIEENFKKMIKIFNSSL